MTPDDFANLQRSLLKLVEEQTRLMREIRRGITFLGWAIVLALALLLSVMLRR